MSELSHDSPAPEHPGALTWLPVLQGGIAVVFGALLVFAPGRTLVFVATLAGIFLCFSGLLNLMRSLGHGLTGGERAGEAAIGLLALAAGAVVIARPEGSVRTVAIVAGIFLLIMGVTTLVLGTPGDARRLSHLRGVVGLAAGVALLTWPDVTVGVVATIFGLMLLVQGTAELVVGVRLARHSTRA